MDDSNRKHLLKPPVGNKNTDYIPIPWHKQREYEVDMEKKSPLPRIFVKHPKRCWSPGHRTVDSELSLDELSELARTAGVKYRAVMTQKRPAPDPPPASGQGAWKSLRISCGVRMSSW
jgi:hypothetical protein